MAKNRKKSKTARRRRGVRRMTLNPMLTPRELRYRNLLLDPCGADIVDPPFFTAGTGMFVRVRKIFDFPTMSNVTGLTSVNVFAQVVPWYNAVVLRSSYNGSGAWGSGSISRIFTAEAQEYMNRWRPIAGCARLLNMANYSSTSGLMAGAYLPDGLNSVSGMATSNTLSGMAIVRPTSKEAMELKWFPTLPDTEFNSVTETASTADLLERSAIVLQGHGLENRGSSSTAATWTPDCKLEVVMVYEYQPGYTDLGIAAPAKAPYGSLTNVLQSIGDLTAAAFTAYNRVAPAMGPLLNTVSLLSGGSTGYTGTMGRLRIEDAL